MLILYYVYIMCIIILYNIFQRKNYVWTTFHKIKSDFEVDILEVRYTACSYEECDHTFVLGIVSYNLLLDFWFENFTLFPLDVFQELEVVLSEDNGINLAVHLFLPCLEERYVSRLNDFFWDLLYLMRLSKLFKCLK